MAVSNDFLDYVLDQLSAWNDIRVKKMFGGVGLYHNELAFALVAYDVVYLKVDESTKLKFVELDSKPLKPWKTEATVQSFYSVPPDVFEDTDEFVKWAKESYFIQKKRNKE